LAIAEFFNEYCKGVLFPRSELERVLSRSFCAEMHSGFVNLRAQCPFTLNLVEPLSDFNDGIRSEIARLEAIFEQAHLPFMFESAGVVDAFYSILAYRLNAYGVVLKDKAGEYQQSLLNWTTLQAAIKLARTWKDV
jgi:glutathione S-transferase